MAPTVLGLMALATHPQGKTLVEEEDKRGNSAIRFGLGRIPRSTYQTPLGVYYPWRIENARKKHHSTAMTIVCH